jgi:predicted hydrocarbon binding protein
MFVPDKDQQTRLLSSTLSLLTALNNGIEDVLGRGSKGIIFATGMEEGRAQGRSLAKTESLETAIESVNEAFEGVWNVELFKEEGQDGYIFEDRLGLPAAKVIVRECPIRQAVLSNGLKQGGPVCYLTNGNLCGIIAEVMEKKVSMEIEHTGPNSCLKKLSLRD